MKTREEIKEYKHRYYLKNKKRIRQKQIEYYLKNKKNIREYGIEYREKNKEKIRKRKKRYYDENPRKIKEMSKNWKKRNKEYLNNYFKNYNLDEGNKLKASIRSRTWNKYGAAKKCILCNSKKNVEYHHSKPYKVNDFICVCKKCHISKIHKGGKK